MEIKNITQVPEVPENELLAVKEKAFNEFSEAAGKYSNNPFKYMEAVNKIFGEVYSNGFRSGYQLQELNNLLNGPKK